MSTTPRKGLPPSRKRLATPRKRLTGEERRAAILDCALRVFAERGYHASSIDDIAREGGISKALIYEHFVSKQGLYAELLERHASELFDRLAAIPAADQAGSVRLRVRSRPESDSIAFYQLSLDRSLDSKADSRPQEE